MANNIWDFMGGFVSKYLVNGVRVVCFSIHKINLVHATSPILSFEMVLQTPHIHYKNETLRIDKFAIIHEQ